MVHDRQYCCFPCNQSIHAVVCQQSLFLIRNIVSAVVSFTYPFRGIFDVGISSLVKKMFHCISTAHRSCPYQGSALMEENMKQFILLCPCICRRIVRNAFITGYVRLLTIPFYICLYGSYFFCSTFCIILYVSCHFTSIGTDLSVPILFSAERISMEINLSWISY